MGRSGVRLVLVLQLAVRAGVEQRLVPVVEADHVGRTAVRAADLKDLAVAVGLADLLNRPMTDWGVIMSAGVVITIPALLFFMVTQNYLIKGWGAGAVKG